MVTQDQSTARVVGSGETTVSRRKFLAAAGGASFVGLAGCQNGGGTTSTIRMLVQGGYDDDIMLRQIEEDLGVTLELSTVTTPDVIIEVLREGGETETEAETDAGTGGGDGTPTAPGGDGEEERPYDIVVPNNFHVPALVDEGLIEPVNEDAVSNFSDVYDQIQSISRDQFGGDDGFYAVPTVFDWNGYVYDSRNVPDHEPSWATLFSDSVGDTSLENQVVLEKDPYLVVGAAALHLGFDDVFEGAQATITDSQQSEITSLLEEKQHLVHHYSNNNLQYLGEDFAVHQAANSEAVDDWIRPSSGEYEWEKINEWKTMAAPEEGTLASMQAMAVSTHSQDPATAWEVVNEFISPEAGAVLGGGPGSPVSVNPAATEEMPDYDFGADTFGLYDESVLDRLVPMKAMAEPEKWETIYFEAQY